MYVLYWIFILFPQDPNDSILEADEASQIEAAIKASLAESESEKPSPPACEGVEENHIESDSLETFDSDPEDVNYSLEKENPKRTLNGENSFYRKVICASDEKGNSNSSYSETKSSDSESIPFTEELDWKSYLGPADDPESKLMLRLPDGTRDIVSMPSSSKLMVCYLFSLKCIITPHVTFVIIISSYLSIGGLRPFPQLYLSNVSVLHPTLQNMQFSLP